MRNVLFATIIFLGIVIALEFMGWCALYFNSHQFDFLSNKNYFNIRAMLMGNKDPEMLPRYLTLPYLGYIPYPGYKKHGVIQHNQDGYRGKMIPVESTGKYRILCLGGSTTYGFGVDLPSQTYPAQLEKMLNQYVLNDSILSKKYKGVEVINAGLDAGTSAEELQQYLFKYRYYRPNAVVVHSGINDALVCSATAEDFQLDYTHYRRVNFHLEPLPQPARVLMHSYLFSFFAIRLFYSNFSLLQDEFIYQSSHTYCKWSDVNIASIAQENNLELYPFYRNTKTLYQAIVADSAVLLVMPNVLNEKNIFVSKSASYRQYTQYNAAISKNLAALISGGLVPFQYTSISDSSYWIDDCHLNSKGEHEKAQLVKQYVIKELFKY